MPSRRRPCRVAIALPHAAAFIERFLLGVTRHARAAGWTFVRMPERLDPSLAWLKAWDGDGALITVQGPRDSLVARSLTFPVVNLAGAYPDPALPQVGLHHRAVGRQAARFLHQKGHTDLAFYGVAGKVSSQERRRGFEEVCQEQGLQLSVFEGDASTPGSWVRHLQRRDRWLAARPRPSALFASSDERGVEILEACHRLGIRVPADLAVLGVDNDPILCDFAQPPMSSIARPDEEAGFRAAQLLQRAMEARRLGRDLADTTPPQVVLEPGPVVERASTASYGRLHPQVGAVVALLERDFREPLALGDLLAGLPVSRRRLEILFKAELGLSPYQFLLQLRLKHARAWLARNDGATKTTIALGSGFRSRRHLQQALARGDEA